MAILAGVARITIPIGVKAVFWAGVWYIGPAAIIATVGIVPAAVVAGVITLGAVDIVTNLCI